MNSEPPSSPTGRLRGKVAAITGAGRGIGRAAAELFAAEGARVAVLERDAASGREVAKSILDRGGEARFIETDVSSEASVRAAFEGVAEEWRALHVLYNNASVYWGDRDGPVIELSLETWRQVLGINLDSVFLCCKHAIPLMVRGGGGSVINTASSAGVVGIPRCDAYTATKGATVALTRSMAVEYGPRRVRVNCIAPAAIQTPMMRASNPVDSPFFDEKHFLGVRTPLRRYGTPEEIARVALFLASDDSSYLNGAVLVADGGITASGDLAKPFAAQGGV